MGYRINEELFDYFWALRQIGDMETTLPTPTVNPFPPVPTVDPLSRSVHSGDWHDKPLRWQVSFGGKRQLFTTKRDAVKFARHWRKVGNLNEAIRNWLAAS